MSPADLAPLGAAAVRDAAPLFAALGDETRLGLLLLLQLRLYFITSRAPPTNALDGPPQPAHLFLHQRHVRENQERLGLGIG